MYDFAYQKPGSVADAVKALGADPDAKALAGGQTFIPVLKQRLNKPSVVVDLAGLGLSGIKVEGGKVVIGAMTKHHDVATSAEVRKAIPGLVKLASMIGDHQVRHRGTIGGSLAHADPAAELPAVLLALGGHVCAQSLHGEREIAAEALFVSQLQTALTDKELLTEAWFPAAPPRSGAAFVEVSRRHGDFALVGVAVQLTLSENGTISAAHLALMGVAETPIRVQAAEELLIGEQPGEALFDAAAVQATANLDPDTDLHASAAYRRHVASVLVSRALHTAAERAHQEGNDE